MKHSTALFALAELNASRGLFDPYQLAERATAILDRAEGNGLKPLDVVDYLRERGLNDLALVKAVGAFAPVVLRHYESKHRTKPLKRLALINGARRPIYAYVQDDRPLFDRAWDDIAEKHDAVGAALDRIVGEHVLAEQALVGSEATA